MQYAARLQAWLTSVGAIVDRDAVSLLQIFLLGDLACNHQQVPKKLLMAILYGLQGEASTSAARWLS